MKFRPMTRPFAFWHIAQRSLRTRTAVPDPSGLDWIVHHSMFFAINFPTPTSAGLRRFRHIASLFRCNEISDAPIGKSTLLWLARYLERCVEPAEFSRRSFTHHHAPT